MIDWGNEENDLIIEEWGHSPIEWQQKNRDILNEAIKAYNEYVTKESYDLDKAVKLIKYAERKLKNECGTYMDDIELMKENLDSIVDME